MMKKAIVLLLVLLTVICMAACGSSTDETAKDATAAPTTPAETEALTSTALDTFVNDNNAYFDINISETSIANFSLTVGSETVKESGQIAYNKDDVVTLNGEPAADAKFYVYAVMKAASSESSALQQFVSVGVKSDKIADLLAKLYGRLGTCDKVYIAILDKPDGWNHDLDAKLNEFLSPVVVQE